VEIGPPTGHPADVVMEPDVLNAPMAVVIRSGIMTTSEVQPVVCFHIGKSGWAAEVMDRLML
jgi:hypothetical protein